MWTRLLICVTVVVLVLHAKYTSSLKLRQTNLIIKHIKQSQENENPPSFPLHLPVKMPVRLGLVGTFRSEFVGVRERSAGENRLPFKLSLRRVTEAELLG